MTLIEAMQCIKDRRNELDLITDSTNPSAQFTRTSNTFSNDGEVAPLTEALSLVIVAIHEDEIQITP